MTTDTHPDVRPGTVPSWVLRCAYDGEEWLVLGDARAVAPYHEARACIGHAPPHRYQIGRSAGLSPCGGCGLMVFNLAPFGVARLYNGDSLAEAHAAFDRIEQEWRARHDEG